jgi:small-conductance mechanosensitive channel
MLKFTLHLLCASALLLTAIAPSHAQLIPAATNTSSTNAPAATPPNIYSVGEVITQAQSATTKLQQTQAGLEPDTALATVNDQLSDLKKQIDDRVIDDKRLLETAASLSALQSSQATWQGLSDTLAAAQKNLSARVRDLDNQLGDLNQMDVMWAATQDAATRAKAPAEIMQSIHDVIALIATTNKAVLAHLVPLYAMQNQVAAQDKLTQSGITSIKKAIDAGWTELFQRNHPPLWDPLSLAEPKTGVMTQEKASLGTQFSATKTYLHAKIGAVLIHVLLFAFLLMGLYWVRSTMQAQCRDKPALQHAAEIFAMPFATALLLALLAGWFLYPDAPRFLLAFLGAIALFPAVVVTRRLIDPANFPILYAAVIAYLVDQVRYVVTPAGIVSRFLFIFELLAVVIFILAVFRSKHLCSTSEDPSRLKFNTRLYLHLTYFVLLFAGFANVFGYIPLSIQAGNGMLESSYLAVVLYAAVRIADAFAISALSIPPLSRLGMVRRHQDNIYDNTTACIRWGFLAIWVVAALKIFIVYDPLLDWLGMELGREHKWGSFGFQLGSALAFPITIWAAFLLSRIVRFTLEEELYPHLPLGRGIPYATSTMIHYTILVLGFFIAAKAGGADLTQFSFLAGAFGVGLGFGLQNIFNNFMSGIILLFEQPIKVGDDIQIDATTMGRVERIGIRASVILLTNGSELIVPNGNLISNPVTNWTLSNCERLIEIPVNITSKVEPAHAIDFLTKVAAAHPNVLKNPAPHTLLVTLGATMNFRVRAWIDSEEEWLKIQSELAISINAALLKENITIA